ncbi:MAG: hypothetical protein EHM73_13615 [Chroococcales cyanobacterium metabat2.561]|nr:MAG: hypothetical protein EHM73_13615 [Chroococcales cyanobacterium metabat2.561]
MATPPDFTTGAILTAAQMNAVGLWLVKTQVVGTGVSSVTVTGAFSADYDNYRITYTGGITSGGVIQMTIGAANTQYYASLIYASSLGSTALANVPDNNAAQFSFAGFGNANFAMVRTELTGPFLTTRTTMAADYISDNNFGHVTGVLNDATSHTSFKFTPAGGGTMTGGIIRVYGYRN